jgi:hypothetical protein
MDDYPVRDLLYSIRKHNENNTYKKACGYSKLKRSELIKFIQLNNIKLQRGPKGRRMYKKKQKRKMKKVGTAKIGPLKKDIKPSQLKYTKTVPATERKRQMVSGKSWTKKTSNYAKRNNITFKQAKKELGYGK